MTLEWLQTLAASSRKCPNQTYRNVKHYFSFLKFTHGWRLCVLSASKVKDYLHILYIKCMKIIYHVFSCMVFTGLFSPDFQCFSADIKLFFSCVTVFFRLLQSPSRRLLCTRVTFTARTLASSTWQGKVG